MQKASHTWRRPALRRLQNMQQKASQAWRRPAPPRAWVSGLVRESGNAFPLQFRKQTRIYRPGAGPPRHDARGRARARSCGPGPTV